MGRMVEGRVSFLRVLESIAAYGFRALGFGGLGSMVLVKPPANYRYLEV